MQQPYHISDGVSVIGVQVPNTNSVNLPIGVTLIEPVGIVLISSADF